MKRLDLIIDALETSKPINQESSIPFDKHLKALAVARELRELKPVAPHDEIFRSDLQVMVDEIIQNEAKKNAEIMRDAVEAARIEERDKCAQDYLQDCADAVEAARLEERKGMECVLDQALKDQKDAERYMHLKHILIDSTISKKFEGSTPKDIDDLLDELVRSYDE